MSITLLLVALTLALIVLLAGKGALRPEKLVVRLGANSVLGLVILWLVNFAGNYIGFNIPLNPFTVLVTGFLGLPGLAILSMLEFVVR